MRILTGSFLLGIVACVPGQDGTPDPAEARAKGASDIAATPTPESVSTRLQSATSTLRTRDSGGVRIADHDALPVDLPLWSFPTDPELTIGSADGPTAFGRITAVVRRADGVIVVADASDLQLRAFGRSGTHLWSVGRKGEGPGEFRSLTTLSLYRGDSVIAIDANLLRATVFDPGGGAARTIPLAAPPGGSSPTILGATTDGYLVGRASLSGPPPKPGRYRIPTIVAYYSPSGEFVARADSVESGEFYASAVKGPDGEDGWSSFGFPLGRKMEAAVRGNASVLTTQDRWEVRQYGPRGALAAVVRVQAPPILMDALIRKRLEENNVRRISTALPDSLPAIGRVGLDANGRLWVEEYVLPYETRPPAWWVIDRDGKFIARAVFPSGFTPHQMDTDRVVGVVRDSLDVPYVKVFRIER